MENPNSPCCEIGEKLRKGKGRLLCETENFFVFPTLGPIGIEGYLLIATKQHYLGFGMIPSEQYPELNELIKDTKKIIKEVYKKPTLIFEHGPRIGEDTKPGKSIDHAHLHVIPADFDILKEWSIDLMSRLGNLGQFYRVERIEGFKRASDLIEQEKSYLYVESTNGSQYMSEQNFCRPSQYFRKMVANHISPSKWNWRYHPCKRTIDKTMDSLASRF